MKVVLDTNVLLSAAFTAGRCEVLLDLCVASGVDIILCDHILDEFRRHAQDKFHAPRQRVDNYLQALMPRVVLVTPLAVSPDTVADVDDLPVLGTAAAARADALITGDRQLLELGFYAGIPILSPRAFYERLRS